jgi:hypothetical protein
MLLLLVTATQGQPPPINVTVQTPQGWPIWETTLFPAVIGAAFGVGSSLLMEVIKPRLERGRTTQIVSRHLALEIIRSAYVVELAISYLRQSEASPEDPEYLKTLAVVSIESCKHPIFDRFISKKITL